MTPSRFITANELLSARISHTVSPKDRKTICAMRGCGQPRHVTVGGRMKAYCKDCENRRDRERRP